MIEGMAYTGLWRSHSPSDPGPHTLSVTVHIGGGPVIAEACLTKLQLSDPQGGSARASVLSASPDPPGGWYGWNGPPIRHYADVNTVSFGLWTQGRGTFAELTAKVFV